MNLDHLHPNDDAGDVDRRSTEGTPPTIDWQWCRLDDLPARQLYAVVAARIAVFVVEQNCPYQDLDGLDFRATHLIGWERARAEVAAYLRVLEPGTRFAEPSIGRVLTTSAFRGAGLGRELTARGLDYIEKSYPGAGVRISAQEYLERFYRSFGFETVSERYMEDDIPHVEMLRPGGVP
jgi:ElaA protein